MSSANTKEEVSCESCGKIYPKTSLLKHIAHSKPCKVHYGDERIKELKKANRKATQCTYFKKYYSKNADSEKERMRKNYDENFNYHSAIKKEYYQKNKENYKRKYQENKDQIKKKYQDEKAKELEEMPLRNFLEHKEKLEKKARETNFEGRQSIETRKKDMVKIRYGGKECTWKSAHQILDMMQNYIEETFQKFEDQIDSIVEKAEHVDLEPDGYGNISKLYSVLEHSNGKCIISSTWSKVKMEVKKRQEIILLKEGNVWRLEFVIETFKELNGVIPLKFTEFQKAMEEKHREDLEKICNNIEKEIDMIAQKAEGNCEHDLNEMYKKINITCQLHVVEIQIDMSMKKFSDEHDLNHKCIRPSNMLALDNGTLKCFDCKLVYEPQADSFNAWEMSSVIRKEKHLIRKRKPMNITVADLEESMDLDDEEFKADVGPIKMRTMPRRNREKNMVSEDLEYLENSDSESLDLLEESESDD